MKKAKVLVFAPNIDNATGGGDISFIEIINILENDERFEVFTYSLKNKIKGMYKNAIHQLTDEPSMEEAESLVYDNNIDIVITQFNYIPIAKKYFHKVKIVGFVRGFDYLEKNDYRYDPISLTKDLVQAIDYFNFKKSYLEALDRIFVVANSDYTKDKLTYIYEVDVDFRFYPLINEDSPFAEGDFVEGDFAQGKGEKILLVTPQKRKGVEIFIKLAKLNPEFKFICIGNTSNKYKRKFVRLKNIEYIPWTNNIDEYLLQTAVVLVPSIVDETYGRIVIEGKKYGIPSIVSARGGLKESAGNSSIVLPIHVEEWNIALRKLMADKSFYNTLSELALEDFRLKKAQDFIDIENFKNFLLK